MLRALVTIALCAVLAGCSERAPTDPGLHVALQPALNAQRWTLVVTNSGNASYAQAVARIDISPLGAGASGSANATLDIPPHGYGQAVLTPHWAGMGDATYSFRLFTASGQLLDEENAYYHQPCLPGALCMES